MFKKGDKLLCIDASSIKSLSVNNIYTFDSYDMIYSDNSLLFIEEFRISFFTKRFRKLDLSIFNELGTDEMSVEEN